MKKTASFTGVGADSDVFSDAQDTWNIADGFTKIKLLRILINLDRYESLARFGKQDVEDMVDPSMIPYNRVEGMERYLFELKQVIGNVEFGIDPADRLKLARLLRRLDSVENVIDGISETRNNFVTNEVTLKINEDHFTRCFRIIREVKDEFNYLLNRGGFIFRISNATDIDNMLEKIADIG